MSTGNDQSSSINRLVTTEVAEDMFNLFKKKKQVEEVLPGRESIVPRIKAPAFLSTLQSLQIPDDQMPVTEPLIGELLVTYSFDLPDMFQMVTKSDLERLGLSLEQAREIAIDNLHTQMPQIGSASISEDAPFQQIVTGDNLEACTLLAAPFWDQLAEAMGSDVVVVAPHRDAVFFTSVDSEEGVVFLRELAKTAMADGDTHSLSEQMMVWRESKWHLLDG